MTPCAGKTVLPNKNRPQEVADVDSLKTRIQELLELKRQAPVLILLGGCARVGKTTLAGQLVEWIKSQSTPALLVSLDSWLIDHRKRRPHSTVLERYECGRISAAITKILSGETVYPPVYEAASRQRLTEKSEQGLALSQGVILVEGVISLALPILRENADLAIFVTTEDEIRLQRLQSFYRFREGLEQEAEEIITERENEEVPFIKETAAWADVILKT